MPNLVIIFDSKTGYTETMAKAIVEGTKSVEGVTVSLKKLDDLSSLTLLDGADSVPIGSPSHNGYVTLDVLIFLANIKQAIDTGTLKIDKKFGLLLVHTVGMEVYA